MSLTKKPMKPMMAKPMAVAKAIFWNSETKQTETRLVGDYASAEKRIAALTFAVGLGAFLDQTVRVLEELFARLDVFVNLIHSVR